MYRTPLVVFKHNLHEYSCINFTLLIMILFSQSGCVSFQNRAYLQETFPSTPREISERSAYADYRLQVGDNIGVEVRSIDRSVTEIFKFQGTPTNSSQYNDNPVVLNYLTGYRVNVDGTLAIPLIGSIHVLGKTIEQTSELIVSELENFINEPFVIVRMDGIRYSAVGEFQRPGSYTVLQNKLTIFEAIANAGDLSNLANRKKVSLIRQEGDEPVVHLIDLTSDDLLASPFYYLKHGDLLYVEPLKITGFKSFLESARDISLVLGGISVVILLSVLAFN
jgi:polysaccharide biosynthesis/export protein